VHLWSGDGCAALGALGASSSKQRPCTTARRPALRPHTQKLTAAATNGKALLPHLPSILDTLAAGLQHYGRRTLRVLLDALSTLAGVVGPALGDPALAQRFMPQVKPLGAGVPRGGARPHNAMWQGLWASSLQCKRVQETQH
jgi:hypothetical protein